MRILIRASIRFRPDAFTQQVKRLAEQFHIATPEEVEAFVLQGRELPRDSVLITFDDGLVDHAETARQILDPMGVKAVFFVCSRPLTEQRAVPCTRSTGCAPPRNRTVSARTFSPACRRNGAARRLSDDEKKAARSTYIYDRPQDADIKYLLNFLLPEEVVDAATSAMLKRAGVSEAEFCRRTYMDGETLRALDAAGHRVEAHTHDHRPVTRLGAKEEELMGRHVRALHHILGRQPQWISFPYGRDWALPPDPETLLPASRLRHRCYLEGQMGDARAHALCARTHQHQRSRTGGERARCRRWLALKSLYLGAVRRSAALNLPWLAALLILPALRTMKPAKAAEPRTVVILTKEGFTEDVITALADAGAIKVVGLPRIIVKALASPFLPYFIDDNNYASCGAEFDEAKLRYRRFIAGLLKTLRHFMRIDAMISGNFSYASERELASAMQEMGVPFIALHKENLKTPGRVEFFERIYKERRGPFTGRKILVYNQIERDLQIRAGGRGAGAHRDRRHAAARPHARLAARQCRHGAAQPHPVFRVLFRHGDATYRAKDGDTREDLFRG